MPFFVFAAAAVKIIPWIVGGIAGIYATKKVTEAFGSTPKNELKNLGVPPERVYEDAKKFKEDERKYLDDLNKEDKKEIKKLSDKVEKLEEEKVTLSAQLKDLPKDSDEYKRVVAQIAQIDDKMAGLNKEIEARKGKVKEREEKVAKTFTGIGDPTSMSKSQYLSRANGINFGSYKNYIIIFVCLVVVIMIIGFFKKMLGLLLNSLKS